MDLADIRAHVRDPIIREYRAAFAALRKTVMAFPEDEWTVGKTKANEPIRQACHLLFAVEGYLGGHKARVGGRFGVPVESFAAAFDPKKCPGPSDLIPWVDEVEKIATTHIDKAVDKSLKGSRKKHPPLNRVIYALRHTIVHLAILRRELFERGIDRPRY